MSAKTGEGLEETFEWREREIAGWGLWKLFLFGVIGFAVMIWSATTDFGRMPLDGSARAVLAGCVVFVGLLTWIGLRYRAMPVASVAVDARAGMVRFRHCTFLRNFARNPRETERSIPFFGVFGVRMFQRENNCFTEIETAWGRVSLCNVVDGEGLSSVLETIVTANRERDPDGFARGYSMIPSPRTAWWGWLILAAGIGSVMWIGWKVMYAG